MGARSVTGKCGKGLTISVPLADGASLTTIPLSGYMALAPLAGASVGFGITAARCVVSGGRYGGFFRFLRIEWRIFLLIALLDACGGALFSVAFWIASPQRLASFGDVATTAPWVFWAVIGSAGPLVISGVMRWLPTRKTVRPPAFVFDDPEIVAKIVVFRKQLTGVLYDTIQQHADAWQDARNDWLMSCLIRSGADGRVNPRRLMKSIRRVSARRGAVSQSSERWVSVESEPTFISNDPLVYRELLERMAEMAIECGLESAIATSCGLRINDFSPSQAAEPAYRDRVLESDSKRDWGEFDVEFDPFTDDLE